jgi:hypothetical protein
LIGWVGTGSNCPPRIVKRLLVIDGSILAFVGKQILLKPVLERAVRKPKSLHFSPALLPRNNRSFDWFVIGEKESRQRIPVENPPLQSVIVRN